MQATSKEAEMQAGKEAKKKAKTCWSLYLLRREDGAIYTGISTNVERRFKEHTAGRGSRALRGKPLIAIEYSVVLGSRSLASQAEHRVKKLTKPAKESLIKRAPSLDELLAFLDLAID
jgi:putative endonuclease